MSIYCSWPEIGEDEDGNQDQTVLSYMRSHVYPDPVNHLPATVGIAHIPGWIGPDGDREDITGPGIVPYAPYLRLDLCTWQGKDLVNTDEQTVILTRRGAEELRDQLTRWLTSPMRDE